MRASRTVRCSRPLRKPRSRATRPPSTERGRRSFPSWARSRRSTRPRSLRTSKRRSALGTPRASPSTRRCWPCAATWRKTSASRASPLRETPLSLPRAERSDARAARFRSPRRHPRRPLQVEALIAKPGVHGCCGRAGVRRDRRSAATHASIDRQEAGHWGAHPPAAPAGRGQQLPNDRRPRGLKPGSHAAGRAWLPRDRRSAYRRLRRRNELRKGIPSLDRRTPDLPSGACRAPEGVAPPQDGASGPDPGPAASRPDPASSPRGWAPNPAVRAIGRCDPPASAVDPPGEP